MPAAASAQIDPGPPLYCWIVNIDRPATTSEFNLCYDCLDPPSQIKVFNQTRNSTPEQAWACLLGRLIPHVIMSQRGAVRGQWYITGNEEGMKPRLFAPAMEKQIGYSAARDKQIVALAFALGREDRVAQVGCDVHRIHLSKHIPIEVYLDSISHKLCDSERRGILMGDHVDRDRIIGRVAIIWTLKEALMKAIGQPLRSGFDWRRVCFNVAEETATMDGAPITGWEFRLFMARLPDAGRLGNKTYRYQVACAIHRGGESNKFTWNQKGEVMDEWLRFLTVDTIMERVWAFDYPHVQQALLKRRREEEQPEGIAQQQEPPGPPTRAYSSYKTSQPINKPIR